MNDIKFNITEDMINILYNIMSIKELLEKENIDNNIKKDLENQFLVLREQFIIEFRRNNRKQINKYRESVKE